MSARILVVDDSVSMRQMTGIILKGAGYTVTEASNGDEALAALTDDTELVITDFNMPNMNGAELTRAIRAGSVAKAVPIIVVTTEFDDAKKRLGKEAGATAWITKPFAKDQLLQTIERVLGGPSF